MRCFAIFALSILALAGKPLPYELIAPSAPTGREEVLIIALHGAASTAKFYCGMFVRGKYEKLANERNYLLVCPAGVGVRPRYEEYEDRILELRAALLVQYPSVKKVFLTGHSLGGRGALLLGLRNPDKFDAVAPVAPALRLRKDRVGTVDAMVERLLLYPHRVFFAYGLRDIIAPLMPEDLAKLTVAGAGRLEPHVYNADHFTVSAASAEDLFDFFDRQTASATLVARDGNYQAHDAREGGRLRCQAESQHPGASVAAHPAAAR